MAKSKDAAGGGTMGGTAQTVTIELPWAAVSEKAYLQRHVELQLDRRQGVALRAVFNALEADPPARLKPARPGDRGRVVQAPPDAIRYMLEAVADALGVDKDALGTKTR